MIKAPLKIDFCFPSKIRVDHIVDGDPGVEVVPTCKHQFYQNKDKSRVWQVTLQIDFKGKDGAKAVHEGSVEFVGIFTVYDEIPEEKMSRIVAVNCPMLLYSSARELVALLTGRGPFRTLLLPTVSFSDGNIQMDADEKTNAIGSKENGENQHPNVEAEPKLTRSKTKREKKAGG